MNKRLINIFSTTMTIIMYVHFSSDIHILLLDRFAEVCDVVPNPTPFSKKLRKYCYTFIALWLLMIRIPLVKSPWHSG